jgi:hypothetical protein
VLIYVRRSALLPLIRECDSRFVKINWVCEVVRVRDVLMPGGSLIFPGSNEQMGERECNWFVWINWAHRLPNEWLANMVTADSSSFPPSGATNPSRALAHIHFTHTAPHAHWASQVRERRERERAMLLSWAAWRAQNKVSGRVLLCCCMGDGAEILKINTPNFAAKSLTFHSQYNEKLFCCKPCKSRS